MEYKKIKGTLTDSFRSGSNSLYELNEYITSERFGETTDPFKYVVISDANTHIERVVFPARLVDGMTEEDVRNDVPGTLKVDYGSVEGVTTMMINGGDFSTIEPPENYLQRLVEDNKQK